MSALDPASAGQAGRDRVRGQLGARSIVLVGMMGCGKTTVGRLLAARLGLPFVDADQEIEMAANMTIPEIFAAHGEAYFRAGEQRVIARLLGHDAQVLATGGGAFMNEDTRREIARSAISVWLNADFDTLYERVVRKSNRPLLQGADVAGTMRRLLRERVPVYRLADVTVDSRNIPHEAVVSEIVAALDGFLVAGEGAESRDGLRKPRNEPDAHGRR